jgi:dethiobiotin synthetase
MRGLFVTGTDTEVGKSMLAAAVCAGLTARGLRVAAFKPAVTGLDEEAGGWPPDHELLASVTNAGQSAEELAPARFGPPVSPHHAAELAGEPLNPDDLVASAEAAGVGADVLICEGVGGLMVPLARDYLIRDLAVELGLPLLVAARPDLGTINHSLLTVEAARAAGLEVAAVVLTPWREGPSPMERSNRQTIAALAGVTVATLPVTRPERRSLAAASLSLPLDDWLASAIRPGARIGSPA